MKPAFVGGALSFKDDKKKKKKKKKKVKHELKKDEEITVPEEELTEAQKKALRLKEERERKELEKVASKSHRDRVEEFNEKLGQLTEHNDIPRVSLLLEERFDWPAVCFYFAFSHFLKIVLSPCRSVLLETVKENSVEACV